jgi:hypothetical protein
MPQQELKLVAQLYSSVALSTTIMSLDIGLLNQEEPSLWCIHVLVVHNARVPE